MKFDDKGLKQGEPGKFENFYGNIEGYTHEDGVRNVVRVKRYEVKNPPADAPSQAYVLDMVVESAIESDVEPTVSLALEGRTRGRPSSWVEPAAGRLPCGAPPTRMLPANGRHYPHASGRSA